jgi:hypothetical protein
VHRESNTRLVDRRELLPHSIQECADARDLVGDGLCTRQTLAERLLGRASDAVDLGRRARQLGLGGSLAVAQLPLE